jgi:CHAT domain-containing protein
VQWTPCKDGQCGSSQSTNNHSCDAEILDRKAAVELLLSNNACLDRSISELQKFAVTDPAAKSDLAAAYYVRAQRYDQPIDWLSSLDAANGDSATSLFNRALAQEALGLNEDALTSWQQFVKADAGKWADEAREHIARLQGLARNDSTTRWKEAKQQLKEALRRRDAAAVASLIAPFPLSAQKYFENEAIRNWADEPTAENLEAARMLATHLSVRLKNPFDLDVMRAIDQASGAEAVVLRDAHRAFAGARQGTFLFKTAGPAANYARAASMFARSRSPFELLADLGRANALRIAKPLEALALMNDLSERVQSRHYAHLLARVRSNRSNLLFYEGRGIEALGDLETALTEYRRLSDQESIDSDEVARIGIHRTIGQLDVAWRETIPTVCKAMQVVDTSRRHALFGEAAITAAELGHEQIGVAYLNMAIRLIQRGVIATVDTTEIRNLHSQQAMALRARAGIKAMGRLSGASEDINEAFRLSEKDDDQLTQALQAHVEEANGETLLRVKPKEAAEAFSRALALTEGIGYPTLRTRLFARRADARRRLKQVEDAKSDLRSALDELRIEEATVLANRPKGVVPEVWSAYFSRFQETYRLLIRQLVEEQSLEEAFRYTEKARTYEPLNLVSARHTAPREFSGISVRGEPAPLRKLQERLPPGTVLFEYCVLDDHTYTWIISHDGFDVVKQLVPRERIRSWNAQLQRAVERPDLDAFDAVLIAQYEGLIAAPLRVATKILGGRPPSRLVIIPDDAMHGLPLAASRRSSDGRPFLIEQMPVEIDGSATLYLLSLLRDRELASSPDKTALLIGDPAFDQRLARARTLPRLTGARHEVEQIGEGYAPFATIRTDAAATVPEFMRLAKESAVVHVAAHGIVDTAAPSRSAIFLAPSSGSDGVLDAETLLKSLKLHKTRLIVLASCSSAGGLPVGAEGVAPLVRPLIAAGAPAVIGSLWKVDDATAADLFVSFHQHYREGNDAAVALQKAQIEMLKKRMTWASFQVIGHASSPFATRATSKKEKPP